VNSSLLSTTDVRRCPSLGFSAPPLRARRLSGDFQNPSPRETQRPPRFRRDTSKRPLEFRFSRAPLRSYDSASTLMATTVKITKRGVERVRARHSWIYRSDLTDHSSAQPGEIVRVADPRGRVVGTAFYSSLSQIALRIVAFEDVEPGRELWLSRLLSAERL